MTHKEAHAGEGRGFDERRDGLGIFCQGRNTKGCSYEAVFYGTGGGRWGQGRRRWWVVVGASFESLKDGGLSVPFGFSRCRVGNQRRGQASRGGPCCWSITGKAVSGRHPRLIRRLRRRVLLGNVKMGGQLCLSCELGLC